MAFKTIPVEGAVDATIVNRIQAAVAQEFAALTNPNGFGITPIASSKQLTTYQLQSTDRYLVVDASGGPISINLPPPGNQQVVTILRSDSSTNVVKVTYRNSTDSKKGSTTVTLSAPTTFLNTGTTWIQF